MGACIKNSKAISFCQKHRVSRFTRQRNSIAIMIKKPTPTAESRAIKAAIDESGMRQADIAPLVGVEPSMVSQWATGFRPMAADKAPIFARAVNYTDDIGKLSAAYREVYSAQGSGAAVRTAEMTGDLRDIGLIVSRLENDIHALNLALGVLVGVMKKHRPTEAEDAAALLQRMTPAKYQGKGMLGELLAALEKPARAR